MAKRFTDSEKWKDRWFCELTEKEKLFWVYLVDNCDHAGTWRVNWPLVEFHIPGFVFNPSVFQKRITQISNEKWWVVGFVKFQYGELNPNNRAHASVISLLAKEAPCKPLASPLQGHKDKDKDKDKDKNPEKEEKDRRLKPVVLTVPRGGTAIKPKISAGEYEGKSNGQND